MNSDDLLRSGELPEEEITRAENRWVLVVCGITILIVATFAASAALFHDALPSSVEPIQSDQIHRSGEFVESNLGTAMQLDGSAVVRLVLQQFSFSPSIIRVPVNTPVVIRAVSADVIHGFLLEGTNVNAMVVPGYVTTVRAQFKGNTWYYVGLILIFLGSWVWVAVMLTNLTVWKIKHRNVPVPLAMFASCAGGLVWFWTSLGVTIELLGSVVPYLLGWTTTIDAGLGRVLFSWTLHGIVYFWLIPSYVAFYTMVPQEADARLYSDTMGRLTFILFLIFSVPVGMHHIFGDPEAGGGPKFVHALFTSLVAVPTLLTVFSISASLEIGGRLRSGKGLFGWIGALPWERPMVLACGLSLIMLGLGGVGGLINMSYGLDNTVHNTQWVTAHFHLIYGGAIVIMYFAIAYELWPKLTGRRLYSVRLARWQLWLWFIGIMVTTIPWHLVGLMGQPRRMAFFDYHNPAIAPQAPYVAVSVLGAFIIVLSSVLLIVNLLATHFQPKEALDNRVRFALAVNPPIRVPRALNGFAVWNALLFVLMIVNYGLPLTQVISLKQSHRTAPFAVGETGFKEQ